LGKLARFGEEEIPTEEAQGIQNKKPAGIE
jgi:hypothetical protein